MTTSGQDDFDLWCPCWDCGTWFRRDPMKPTLLISRPQIGNQCPDCELEFAQDEHDDHHWKN